MNTNENTKTFQFGDNDKGRFRQYLSFLLFLNNDTRYNERREFK